MGKVLSKPSARSVKKAGPRFQRALDAVEALPLDERDMVMEILKKRQIEARRDQLAESIKKADQEYERGEVVGGTIDELLKALADA